MLEDVWCGFLGQMMVLLFEIFSLGNMQKPMASLAVLSGTDLWSFEKLTYRAVRITDLPVVLGGNFYTL
jgi:hypothetical protein